MKSGMDMKFDPYGELMITAIVLIVFHLILLLKALNNDIIIVL